MSIVIVELTDDQQQRLDEAVSLSSCSEAEWVTESIMWALEHDEEDRRTKHLPLITRIH